MSGTDVTAGSWSADEVIRVGANMLTIKNVKNSEFFDGF